jgi:hypothetical protein
MAPAVVEAVDLAVVVVERALALARAESTPETRRDPVRTDSNAPSTMSRFRADARRVRRLVGTTTDATGLHAEFRHWFFISRPFVGPPQPTLDP